ncbi:P2 family phage major capsid protein [Sodalis glossinidius]|uniref:P2 family phage major capsid protein n=1 Tax=Sodalis glossinidius TaxID=63612 RepID=UPI0009FC69D1
MHTLTAHRYRCEQTNFDTFLSYTQIDAWSGHPQFHQMISDQIARQEANDRLMVGFNGTSRAAKSDRAKHPLLQDTKKGWLQHLREDAPQRIMKGITLTQRDEDGKIVAKGKYAHLDALVYDALTSLLKTLAYTLRNRAADGDSAEALSLLQQALRLHSGNRGQAGYRSA